LVRVALLSYRSKPFCGGQGVYVRHLSRSLVAAGHDVAVFSGPPYPALDEGVGLTRLPSLDLYREPDPFRVPRPSEFRSPVDLLEFAIMGTAGFPEPLTFSLRAHKHLAARLGDFDVIHDNQSLGYGLLRLQRAGVPVVATVHHPITIDRRLELAAAPLRKQLTLRRWYGFTTMQRRVVRRLASVATVSRSSYDDIVREFGVDPARLRIIHVGVDTDVFTPGDEPRVPGRVVAVASADVPLKGVVHLLEALAKVRTERDAELVLVGDRKPGSHAERALDRLGLHDAVTWRSQLSDVELASLFRTAEIAVVPSLYEGFSLPAIEAMACSTPLVTTTGGALPEVVGADGLASLHVPPGDSEALADAMRRLFDDPSLRVRLGAGGRSRVLERFTWASTAAATADWYADAGARAC
jgi:MMP alpha-(1->4)-mannosyltransferase